MARVQKTGLVTACELQKALQGQASLYNLGDTSSLKPRTSPSIMTRRRRKKSAKGPTPCQRDRRYHFWFLKETWRGMSVGQKNAWGTFALATPFLNQCGTTYFLSPYRMFVKVNGVLLSFGYAALLIDPPADYLPPVSMLAYTLSLETQDYFTPPVLMCNFIAQTDLGLSISSIQPRAFTRALAAVPSILLFSAITNDDEV